MYQTLTAQIATHAINILLANQSTNTEESGNGDSSPNASAMRTSTDFSSKFEKCFEHGYSERIYSMIKDALAEDPEVFSGVTIPAATLGRTKVNIGTPASLQSNYLPMECLLEEGNMHDLIEQVRQPSSNSDTGCGAVRLGDDLRQRLEVQIKFDSGQIIRSETGTLKYNATPLAKLALLAYNTQLHIFLSDVDAGMYGVSSDNIAIMPGLPVRIDFSKKEVYVSWEMYNGGGYPFKFDNSIECLMLVRRVIKAEIAASKHLMNALFK